MLDFKFIRAELDQVRQGATDKGVEVDLDRLIELDDQRKVLLTEQEQLRHEQKNAGKEIATLEGDAKQQAAILIIHVIVQCKDIAYVAQIANVLLAFVKKLLDKCLNSNF